MLRQLVALCFVIGALQGARTPLVHRVFVQTNYNAGIVFEYANATLPEDQPATSEAIKCLISQLMVTGLFADIRVTLKPINGEDKVNVDILPTWNEPRDKFVIKEITIEGFAGVDEGQLIAKLQERGLKAGAPLQAYPPPTIRKFVLDSVREIYQSDVKQMYDAEDEVSEFSMRLDLVAPHSVKLRLTKANTLACR
jgi:hypothetical protein